MPRKLTKNADAANIRRLNERLRNEFKDAVRWMEPADKALLADVLSSYSSASNNRPGEVGLASAFEGELASMFLVVLYASEYKTLLERLKVAESFRRKVTIMPKRDVA